MAQTWCTIKHSSKEKGTADTAFGEGLSASWHYPGGIDTLRQAKGFVCDHRQVSHGWLKPNEDNISGVFFWPELAQQHLFVGVPAQKMSPRFQCPDMEVTDPSGPSTAIPSLVLAPSYLPPILTGDLTGNLLTPQAFTQSRLNLELLFMEMKANIVSPLPLEIRGPLRTSEVTASTRCHLFIGTCNLSVPIILRELICFSKLWVASNTRLLILSPTPVTLWIIFFLENAISLFSASVFWGLKFSLRDPRPGCWLVQN